MKLSSLTFHENIKRLRALFSLPLAGPVPLTRLHEAKMSEERPAPEAEGEGKPKMEPIATVQTTAVNIICNILGGGLLVLPAAYDNMSVGPAILITLLMGFFSALSFLFLAIPTEKYQKFSYKDLLTTAFHRHAGKAMDVVLFFYTFGVLIEYAKIVSQVMPKACQKIANGDVGVYDNDWFWLVLASIPFWCFSSFKQLSHLRWTSYLGIVTIYYVVVLIIARFFLSTYSNTPYSYVSNDVRWWAMDVGFLKGFPVLSVCYSCHYNIPPYYGELKDRSIRKFSKAVMVALPLITGTYVVTGLLGYLMFGHAATVQSGGNVMQGFSSNDLPATIGQLGLFIHFCSVFPIVAMGTRRSFNQVIFGTPWHPIPLYVVEAFFIVGLACVLAYFASGVEVVVSIIGSLFSISIVYIIPAAIFLRLGGDGGPPVPALELPLGEETSLVNGSAEKGGVEGDARWKVLTPMQNSILRGIAWGFIIGGIIASVGSFSITVYRIVHPH
jgi:amino acid permease